MQVHLGTHGAHYPGSLQPKIVRDGVGKSYLACALAQKACRDGHSAIYRRAPRLFDELMAACADGTYLRLLQRLAKASVLIIDDLDIEPLGAPERKHLY